MRRTAAGIHAGLVSSDVVPVGGSGQDGGGGAVVRARLWALRQQLGVKKRQHQELRQRAQEVARLTCNQRIKFILLWKRPSRKTPQVRKQTSPFLTSWCNPMFSSAAAEPLSKAGFFIYLCVICIYCFFLFIYKIKWIKCEYEVWMWNFIGLYSLIYYNCLSQRYRKFILTFSKLCWDEHIYAFINT